MRHYVIVGVLVVAASVLLYYGLSSLGLMPVEASLQAVSIDWMWGWELRAMSFLFSLIIVPLFYSLIVFRRKKGDTTDAEHMEGNTRLEISWTVLPLFAVIAYAFMGAKSLSDIRSVDPNAMVIFVHARQFAWTFEYPQSGDFYINELHLPVNKQVVLKMDSADVIHSFWVPEFRVKQDILPGPGLDPGTMRQTDYRITPTTIGDFEVRCAELCGTSHAFMKAPVIVSNQAQFEAWVAEQAALALQESQTPDGQGRLLTVKNGCVGCHSLTGTPLPNAPTWFQLFGSQVKLYDGRTVTADEAYLTESIRTPKAKVVDGYYPSTMPQYSLSDEQIADIIAYLKTLK